MPDNNLNKTQVAVLLASGIVAGGLIALLLAKRAHIYPKLVGFPDHKDVPENAPSDCPGVLSQTAGSSDACVGCPNRTVCASGEAADAAEKTKTMNERLAEQLSSIKHKILILSGKGGVGKSTVATQVAWELNRRGHSVGLLDIDICGPSIPTMTGTIGQVIRSYGQGWMPVSVNENFCVMSIGYLLESEDGAVIWRGPKKNGLIRQFLSDVYWGDLDYLIIDTPPGTSDEHLSIVNYLKGAVIDGAVVVTTPQEVSLQDVRKEINFCKQVSIPILGVVENMSGPTVFPTRDPLGTQKMCSKMEVNYAGAIEHNPQLGIACENGEAFVSNQIQAILKNCLVGIAKTTVVKTAE